jgi:hypothetical protein
LIAITSGLANDDISMQQEQRLRAIGLIPVRPKSAASSTLKTIVDASRLFSDADQPVRLISNSKRSVGRHPSNPSTSMPIRHPDQGHFVHSFGTGALITDKPHSSSPVQGRIRLRFRNLPETAIDRPAFAQTIDSRIRPTSFASIHDFGPDTFNDIERDPNLVPRHNRPNPHFDLPPIDPLYRFAFV